MVQKQTRKHRISRRHVLTALGGTMVGLSGCIGGLLGTNQQVITKTTFKPFKLAVKLRKEASVSRVSLIAPDGTAVHRKSVSAGQTTVELPLVAVNEDYNPLSPGTYTVTAGNNGETVAQQEIKLSVSWNVAEVQVKKSRDLAFTLENTGDLPVKLIDLGVTDGVPSPSSPPQKGASIRPRRVNTENGDELKQFIGGGNRAMFRLYNDTFAFNRGMSKEAVPQWQRKAVKCRGLTHKATLVFLVAPTGKRTYTLPITYGGKTRHGISRTCSKVTAGNVSRK
jgi:hypothetical protein